MGLTRQDLLYLRQGRRRKYSLFHSLTLTIYLHIRKRIIKTNIEFLLAVIFTISLGFFELDKMGMK